RVAMCVRKCSRIVGPCLLVLGVLSMAANILLLFPGWALQYLLEGHISKHAKAMPGVWGGGISVSVPQLAPHPPSSTFWSPPNFWSPSTPLPGYCPQAFISAVLSKLALLGAAACFVLSGVGLTNGPLCFYNASTHGHGNDTLWGYPFLDTGMMLCLHLLFSPSRRTEDYLHNRHTWSICLEPEGIVAWNTVLFSLLLLISAAEMVLASLQILNGCLGCLCGFCEKK
ncbi:T4S1 protein, partial [Tricholaema leucomelas]|nr:T4S1 protein [Tricholaema leucomelas]